MFTGIVEEVGEVSSLETSGDGRRIEIFAEKILDDAELGSSIAINGCCLTMVEIHKNSFVVETVPETLSRTSLGALKKGDLVNMERALSANGRFGGHIVQGHVDGLAKIVNVARESDGSWLVSFSCSKGFLGQIVEKGSITLNGISLTVASLPKLAGGDEVHFDVALIPHTLDVTTFKDMKVGDQVNLEIDVLARYMEGLLSSRSDLLSGK